MSPSPTIPDALAEKFEEEISPALGADNSIAEHFENQVRQNPDRLALETPDGEFSYREINQAANAVAHQLLQKLATTPGPVGLWLDDSFSQTASLLGIWKAGRTFFNNDPHVPSEFNRDILAMVEPAAIITSCDLENAVLACAPAGTRILLYENLLSESRSDNPCVNIPPDTILRLIFTSGSTGTPKTVENDQRSLLVDSMTYCKAADLRAADIQLHVSPLSHVNGSGWILYLLTNGATLSCYPLKKWGMEGMADWIAQKGITRMVAVPTVFRHFINAGGIGPEKLRSVRVVHLGGEKIRRDDLLNVRRFFPATTKVVCNIGSSEAGCIAHYVVKQDTPLPEGPVPSGSVYPGVTILLWDNQENEVSPGEVGEIVVQSGSLARGYFKQPELTSKSFRIDEKDPRIRRFKTGDMGRFDSEGRLVFIGRSDQQVKINGHRVELSDLEATLQSHPLIAAAVVRTWPDPLKEILLAAYYTPVKGETLQSTELESWLKDRVPSYMRPRYLACLEELPTSSIGKVDRNALPPPPVLAASIHPEKLTPIQHNLLDLWRRLFGNNEIGLDDHFFALGGDSLHATQLVSEIEKLTGRPSPIDLLFHSPTVRQLARTIESESPKIGNVVTLQARGSKPPLFMIHGWGGTIFQFADLAHRLGTERPIFGIQGNEHCGTNSKPASVCELAELYSDHIEAQHPTGPYRLMGYSLGGILAFAIATELLQRGKKVELLTVIDTVPRSLPDRVHRKIVVPNLSHRLGVHARSLFRGKRRPDLAFFQGRWNALRYHLNSLEKRQSISHEQSSTQDSAQNDDYYSMIAGTYIPTPCNMPIRLLIASETRFNLLAAWQYLSQGNAHSHTVPGEHHGIFHRANISALAEAIHHLDSFG